MMNENKTAKIVLSLLLMFGSVGPLRAGYDEHAFADSMRDALLWSCLAQALAYYGYGSEATIVDDEASDGLYYSDDDCDDSDLSGVFDDPQMEIGLLGGNRLNAYILPNIPGLFDEMHEHMRVLFEEVTARLKVVEVNGEDHLILLLELGEIFTINRALGADSAVRELVFQSEELDILLMTNQVVTAAIDMEAAGTNRNRANEETSLVDDPEFLPLCVELTEKLVKQFGPNLERVPHHALHLRVDLGVFAYQEGEFLSMLLRMFADKLSDSASPLLGALARVSSIYSLSLDLVSNNLGQSLQDQIKVLEEDIKASGESEPTPQECLEAAGKPRKKKKKKESRKDRIKRGKKTLLKEKNKALKEKQDLLRRLHDLKTSWGEQGNHIQSVLAFIVLGYPEALNHKLKELRVDLESLNALLNRGGMTVELERSLTYLRSSIRFVMHEMELLVSDSFDSEEHRQDSISIMNELIEVMNQEAQEGEDEEIDELADSEDIVSEPANNNNNEEVANEGLVEPAELLSRQLPSINHNQPVEAKKPVKHYKKKAKKAAKQKKDKKSKKQANNNNEPQHTLTPEGSNVLHPQDTLRFVEYMNVHFGNDAIWQWILEGAATSDTPSVRQDVFNAFGERIAEYVIYFLSEELQWDGQSAEAFSQSILKAFRKSLHNHHDKGNSKLPANYMQVRLGAFIHAGILPADTLELLAALKVIRTAKFIQGYTSRLSKLRSSSLR